MIIAITIAITMSNNDSNSNSNSNSNRLTVQALSYEACDRTCMPHGTRLKSPRRAKLVS